MMRTSLFGDAVLAEGAIALTSDCQFGISHSYARASDGQSRTGATFKTSRSSRGLPRSFMAWGNNASSSRSNWRRREEPLLNIGVLNNCISEPAENLYAFAIDDVLLGALDFLDFMPEFSRQRHDVFAVVLEELD
jgi:hypothetical protein